MTIVRDEIDLIKNLSLRKFDTLTSSTLVIISHTR